MRINWKSVRNVLSTLIISVGIGLICEFTPTELVGCALIAIGTSSFL